jgi:hypothetical protein
VNGEALYSEATDGLPTPLAEVLEDVESFIRRYVAFSSDAHPTVSALHVAHAHAVEAADTTGYLHIRSAEKRSGKTRFLEVFELLVPSPIRASTISPSALFRLLDAERRTLLLDEVDAIFSPKSDREELRGLLNAGYRRGSSAWRVEVNGKSYVPRPFDAFGSKILAGIGTLPDTIEDRCITIELRRRRPGEPVERFRYRDARSEAEPIRERLEAWCTPETIESLRAARPTLPNLEDDRALEAWEPLIAIADLAGGIWPVAARAAAVALQGDRSGTEVTDGLLTLGAIRDLFGSDLDRMATDEILHGLARRDDGPWSFWFSDELDRADREGKPALKAARKLRRVVGHYGIESTKLRLPDGTTPRGYQRAAFEDAWSRYLSAPTATTGTTGTPLARHVPDVALVPELSQPDEQLAFLRLQRMVDGLKQEAAGGT